MLCKIAALWQCTFIVCALFGNVFPHGEVTDVFTACAAVHSMLLPV